MIASVQKRAIPRATATFFRSGMERSSSRSRSSAVDEERELIDELRVDIAAAKMPAR